MYVGGSGSSACVSCCCCCEIESAAGPDADAGDVGITYEQMRELIDSLLQQAGLRLGLALEIGANP